VVSRRTGMTGSGRLRVGDAARAAPPRRA
jgi:hypothetical protein